MNKAILVSIDNNSTKKSSPNPNGSLIGSNNTNTQPNHQTSLFANNLISSFQRVLFIFFPFSVQQHLKVRNRRFYFLVKDI